MKLKRLVPMLIALCMCGGAFAGCVNNNINNGNGNNNTNQGDNTNPGDNNNPSDNNTPAENNPSDNTPSGDDKEENKNPEENKEPEENKGDENDKKDEEEEEENIDITVPSTPLDSENKIYVVGDSTVCEFYDKDGNPSDDYFLPRYGYGTMLSQYLNAEESQIKNLAMSGRSSKSFLTENNYKTLKNSIKSGDYLIIGFGHNDEKNDDADRFTDPAGTKDVEETSKGTSLKYCLYQNYVKLAKDAGAIPILCTPVTRYDATGAYSGAKVHKTSDGNYAAAIIALGEETNTTVIDLTGITVKEYKKDNEKAKFYHAHTTYKGAIKEPEVKDGPVDYDGTEELDGRDDTHLNRLGAQMVAYKLAYALRKTDCPLKAQVRENKLAPTYEDDYMDAIKKTYIRRPYVPFSEAGRTPLGTSIKGDTTANWYKTIMGDIGGASKFSNLFVDNNSGIYAVGSTADSGKIANGAGDGFAAAFTQIGVNDNFTIQVKVKVTDVKEEKMNGQTAFGIMLRDDIYAGNNYSTTYKANYSCVGVLKGAGYTFGKVGGELTSPDKDEKKTIAKGDEYLLKMERKGQVVTVYVGGKVKGKFTDVSYVGVDNDYMYICLFAARGVSVEFSSLTLTVDKGASLGA